MTTPAAARFYLAQHLLEMEGKPFSVFNPNNLPIDTLPVIFGFNNGGSPGWFSAVAIAEDGTCLGGHVCSDEGYMPYDLGILEGTRLDRHQNDYQKHYPNGYRMAFIPHADVPTCEPLQKAFELNKAQKTKGTTTANQPL